MAFLGLYGAFGGIGAMKMGWKNLEFDTFTVHEGFETGGTLIVGHLKYGTEATVSEMGVQVGICP